VLAPVTGRSSVPHVRELAAVCQARHVGDDEVFECNFRSFPPEPCEGDLCSLRELSGVAGGEQVAPAVIGVMVRHGLLVQSVRGTPNPHGRRGGGDPPVEETPVSSITELGTSCLQLECPTAAVGREGRSNRPALGWPSDDP
jgi:hypothetical protein